MSFDILSALVRGYYNSEKERWQIQSKRFWKTIMILAGHETTANTIRYSIMMLTIHPELQIKLQGGINRILGDREPDYERDYQARGGVNETLRFFSPVVNLPKYTKKPQPITFNKGGTLFLKEFIFISTPCCTPETKIMGSRGKTEEEAQPHKYIPERWLLETKRKEATDFGEDGLAPEGKDTSKAVQRLVHPIFRCVELEVKEAESWVDAKRRALGSMSRIVDLLLLCSQRASMLVVSG
ncbi:cytochrome P450 [Tirmania nivea]|nr:cytochrome P450 [Tirmania nivea]